MELGRKRQDVTKAIAFELLLSAAHVLTESQEVFYVGKLEVFRDIIHERLAALPAGRSITYASVPLEHYVMSLEDAAIGPQLGVCSHRSDTVVTCVPYQRESNDAPTGNEHRQRCLTQVFSIYSCGRSSLKSRYGPPGPGLDQSAQRGRPEKQHSRAPGYIRCTV